jgi:hypothetical protein
VRECQTTGFYDLVTPSPNKRNGFLSNATMLLSFRNSPGPWILGPQAFRLTHVKESGQLHGLRPRAYFPMQETVRRRGPEPCISHPTLAARTVEPDNRR